MLGNWIQNKFQMTYFMTALYTSAISAVLAYKTSVTTVSQTNVGI